MTSLIVVEKKLNKKKVIIAIAMVIILGVVLFFLWRNFRIEKEEVKEEINTIGTKEEPILITKKEEEKLPTLTEEGKEKVKNIYSLEGHTAYLTFDDGPSNNVTPLILDLLKEKNIKATFFLLGSRVELYPDIVKREYEEGHYLANHGYSHQYSNIYVNTESILAEYNQTEQAIQKAIGKEEYHSHLFRFPGGSVGGPYGNLKQEAIPVLEEQGIMYMDWNALTNDSAGSYTKEKIMESLKTTVGEKKNVVILMHDAGDKILTYETLSEVIDFLIEKGYTFDNFYNIMK